MNDKLLKELEYISQSVGNPVEYTQGGGGNTSVKLDDELMAVKASGFKLKQITEDEGFVVVNYKKIKEYYENIDLNDDRDYEKESNEFVKQNIVEVEGLKKLRPSVEVGFHSILKRYVIHTHPVYANMICCSKDGKDLINKIFKDKDYKTAWIPYINPGFCLTLRINEEIKKCINNSGTFPEVIFMENHGLIVTSDDSSKCVEMHADINDTIKVYLDINEGFPEIEIVRYDKNNYISKTKYLMDYFKNSRLTSEYFDETVLYPDQLVYLNGNISINASDKKLNINTETGEIVYNTNYSEAQTIEETLLAYIFVINGISKSGIEMKTMSEKDIDFIKNWESEAYRKSMVKELGK